MTLVVLVGFMQCATMVHKYASGSIQAEDFDQLLRDNYGCDAIVKSCGNKGSCCDVHDACYKRHGCTAASWFLLCKSS